tara:strand:- start:675 stop:1181 length:507 start_codon:yes stop_codon:yes gene_type:complete
MASGLKRTSSDFFVSAKIIESAANTYTSSTITLPLNALDREVFVITGIIFDPGTPSNLPATQCDSNMQLTRQVATNIIRLSAFNLIGKSTETILGGVAEFDFFSKSYGNQQLESGQDYVDVVATPNMFLGILGNNNTGPLTSDIRVYGYRAKADVGVYSALIASELNA